MKNYFTLFISFIASCIQNGKTLNQILGDLNLMSSQLKDLPKKEDNYVLELSKHSYLPSVNDLENYIAIEYSNAILFASLQPSDIVVHLAKVVSEKRYYFFFTASDFLLSSKLSDKKKQELLFYIDSVRSSIGLASHSFNIKIYNEILSITNSILDVALNDAYAFDIIVKDLLRPFYDTKILSKSVTHSFLDFEELNSLKMEIDNHHKALGHK